MHLNLFLLSIILLSAIAMTAPLSRRKSLNKLYMPYIRLPAKVNLAAKGLILAIRVPDTAPDADDAVVYPDENAGPVMWR